MTKRVFIYSRRSDKRKKWVSISIDDQKSDLIKVCKDKWYIIDKVLEENDTWFIAWKRSVFNEMIRELRERNIKGKWEYIDYVFIKMPSRLSRNNIDTQLILDLLDEEVVEIYTLSDWIIKGIQSRRKFEHDLIDAEYFSKEKSYEWRKNMDKTTKNKWRICINPPFWYKKEWYNNYEEVILNNDNNEANIVKEIFEEYSTWKYTTKSLATHLNLKGYQKTSIVKWKIIKKSFNWNMVDNILNNERYSWIYKHTFDKLKVDDREYFEKEYPYIEIKNNSITIDYTEIIKQFWTFPPIISEYLFKACQNIKKWRKNKTFSEKKRKWEEIDDYIFKWILKCNCKNKIEKNIYKWLNFTAEKAKKIYDSYKCSNNKTKWLECDNTWISWKKVESLFIEKFIKWIRFWELEMKIFEEIISKQLEDLEEWKEDNSKLLEEKLKNLKIQETKTMDSYINEEDEDFKVDIKKKVKQIKEDIKTTESEIEKLSKLNTENSIKKRYIEDYIFYISSLWEKFEKFPKFRKKELIEAMFEYVVLYKWEVLEYQLNPVFELAYNQKSSMFSANLLKKN